MGNRQRVETLFAGQKFLLVKLKLFVKLLTICNFKEKNVHWVNLMVDPFKKSDYFR